MPTLAHSLTTLAKAKEFLGITASTHDALLESLINYVTDFVEGLCGNRRFKETTYTDEDYDVPNGDLVFLRQWPVGTLSAAKYRTGTIASPTYVSFDANDYLLYGDEGYIKFFFTSFRTFEGLTIRNKLLRFTYTAGYKIDFANELTSTHTLPFDLTLLATELVAKKFNLRRSQGIESETTEGQSIRYGSESTEDLSADQKAILFKYQRNAMTI